MNRELLKEAMETEEVIRNMEHAVNKLTPHPMDGGDSERRIAVSFGSYSPSFVSLKLPKQLNDIILEEIRNMIKGEIRVMEGKLKAL